MRKPLRLLVLCTLLASALAAQAQKSRIGLKVGGTLADYSGDDVAEGHKSRGGLCGGVIIHLPVSTVFSVQPELLYVQKGSDNQPFALNTTTTVRGSQRLHYFEVPLLTKFRSQGGFFAELGPTLGYVLSASGTFPNLSGQEITIDDRSLFKALDWGYAAGVGVQTEKGLLLGLRYGSGFSAIFNAGSYRGVNGEPRIHNQTFQLYAGFIFFGRSEPEFSN